MTRHILLKNATTYSRPLSSQPPSGCTYKFNIGAWVENGTGNLFVERAGQYGYKTKKNDIETGEDQKGE